MMGDRNSVSVAFFMKAAMSFYLSLPKQYNPLLSSFELNPR